ncbi:MFS general substrate transporter [Mycena venus]|uniref:MFS general substrate transporter n=1 Tax=Mycena venus TaxID=2733690 RepID=A0A8H7CDP0_9AGAR|nr:MFS general substrate transporter [Mycena venus]
MESRYALDDGGRYIDFLLNLDILSSQSTGRSIMFDRCNNFTLNGGTFNIFGHPREPEHDADYRTIRVGDINLLSLITEEDILESHVIRHRKRPNRIRRQLVITGRKKAYHARIFGSQDVFTAVVYEGIDFSSLKLKVARQSFYRNPNITQLFGITQSPPMNALIYHDELLPLRTALSMCTSYISRQLLRYQLGSQFTQFRRYCEDTLSQSMINLEKEEWFRVSTGQLCIEICQHPTIFEEELLYGANTGHRLGSLRILYPSGCITIPDLMRVVTIDDVLEVLACTGHWNHEKFCHGRMYLGGLYPYGSFCSDDPLVPLAVLPLSFTDDLRPTPVSGSWNFGYIMPNGWTRICLHDLLTSQAPNYRDPEDANFPQCYHFFESFWLLWPSESYKTAMGMRWLAHASEFVGYPRDEYFLVSSVHLRANLWYGMDASLRGTFMSDAPADDIYLCIFTPQLVQQDGLLSIDIPPAHESYYWSFNKDGSEPLSADELDDILPPEVNFAFSVSGQFWNEEDFKIIEEFKMARGWKEAS